MFLKYFECSTYFRVSLLYYFFSFNYFNMLRHRPSSLKSITPLIPNGTVLFLGKIHEVPCFNQILNSYTKRVSSVKTMDASQQNGNNITRASTAQIYYSVNKH